MRGALAEIGVQLGGPPGSDVVKGVLTPEQVVAAAGLPFATVLLDDEDDAFARTVVEVGADHNHIVSEWVEEGRHDLDEWLLLRVAVGEGGYWVAAYSATFGRRFSRFTHEIHGELLAHGAA